MTRERNTANTLRALRLAALVATVALTGAACGGGKKDGGASAAATTTTAAAAAPESTTTSTEATTTTTAAATTTTTAAAPTTTTTTTAAKATTTTVKKSAATEIAIKIFQFMPKMTRVPVGTTVNWTNGDEILHTVTSATRTYDDQGLTKDITPGPPGFDFQMPMKGSKASYTFTADGTFSYLCKIHPNMDAQIVVG